MNATAYSKKAAPKCSFARLVSWIIDDNFWMLCGGEFVRISLKTEMTSTVMQFLHIEIGTEISNFRLDYLSRTCLWIGVKV